MADAGDPLFAAHLAEPTLDPEDWDDFRALAHRVLDLCVDRLEDARERPWRPVPDAVKARLSGPAPQEGRPLAAVAADLERDVLPYATGNTHPRFFGWVHGTGTADGLLAAMVEAAMNSNCGGRDHGALYVEAQVIAWMAETFDFGEAAGGLLVSGASMATLLGLIAARRRLSEETQGRLVAERLTVYAGAGAHNSIEKALDVMGLPAGALRKAPLGPDRAIDAKALAGILAADRAEGLRPLAIVGTLGAVETGASDDLIALSDIARTEGVWLHVDGAFGAWARLAEAPWRDRANGLERADSLAFDFHKWPSVNYDCGCLLVRDGALQKRAFSNRPNYLRSADAGLAGGEPWFCDYGVELSRSFRALKVWTALQTHGLRGWGGIVSKCCRQATLMARAVEAAEDLRLAFEPRLNVCCFHPQVDGLAPEAADALATAIAADLQLAGRAVFSTARIDGRMALRAAIVNHRATDEDIRLSVAAAAEACARLTPR